MISSDNVPKDFPFYHPIRDKPEGFYNGGSGIVAPDGNWVVEPVTNEERLIVADIDPTAVHAAQYAFDPAGHHSRPDVFHITVDRDRQEATTFADSE